MTLKEILMQDLKEAMKNKDTLKKDTIQIIRAGVLQIEKDNKIELDDEGVIGVLSSELKKRNDVLPDYEKSGRDDLVQQVNSQIEIIKSYLPEQLSEEEIIKIIEDLKASNGFLTMKDMGKLMGLLSKELKGKADGKLVSELVKKSLT